MDEEEDIDIAAAMGFSSFGGTKKRKFDHASSPKAATGSGANSTQLGVRTKKVANSEENENETPGADLTDEAKRAQGDGPNKTQATGPSLASFLAPGQTLPETPPGAHDSLDLLVSEDQPMTETVSFGGPPMSRAELNALRNGVRNENGDTAYFLPSFIEDPWAKFAKGNNG